MHISICGKADEIEGDGSCIARRNAVKVRRYAEDIFSAAIVLVFGKRDRMETIFGCAGILFSAVHAQHIAVFRLGGIGDIPICIPSEADQVAAKIYVQIFEVFLDGGDLNLALALLILQRIGSEIEFNGAVFLDVDGIKGNDSAFHRFAGFGVHGSVGDIFMVKIFADTPGNRLCADGGRQGFVIPAAGVAAHGQAGVGLGLGKAMGRCIARDGEHNRTESIGIYGLVLRIGLAAVGISRESRIAEAMGAVTAGDGDIAAAQTIRGGIRVQKIGDRGLVTGIGKLRSEGIAMAVGFEIGTYAVALACL